MGSAPSTDLKGEWRELVLAAEALQPGWQVELVAKDETGSEAHIEAARRTTMFGTITMLRVAAILYLMVIEPTP